MLWRKAWRESRGRFLTGGAALTFLCVIASRVDLTRLPPYLQPTYEQYVWRNVYNGNHRLLFIIITMMLGLGGLLRERSAGTSEFTLALPVSRRRLESVRAMVGLAQTTLLACVPLAIIPTLSPYFQSTGYPVDQALRFAVLFVVWGAAWFAAGFLISSAIAQEPSAAGVALAIPFLAMVLPQAPGFRQVPAADPFKLMSGRDLPFLDATAQVIVGPLPWSALALVAMLAMLLLLQAVRLSERRDF